MGLDLQTARFLLRSAASGTDFAQTATLGRQNLSIHPIDLKEASAALGLSDRLAPIDSVYDDYPFADGLIKRLGAQTFDAIDAAPYEGANVLHDMNLPLPEELTSRYSCVIDGGTIEHVFNFSRMVENVANLLKVGGTLISVNGANNFMGHGFYQFSPELIFRVFSPENGFVIEELLLIEMHRDARWISVRDPNEVRSRLEIRTIEPTYIMFRARKVAQVPMFKTVPQQSDYAELAWQATDGKSVHTPDEIDRLRRKGLAGALLTLPLAPLRRRLRAIARALKDPYTAPHLSDIDWRKV